MLMKNLFGFGGILSLIHMKQQQKIILLENSLEHRQ